MLAPRTKFMGVFLGLRAFAGFGVPVVLRRFPVSVFPRDD